MERLIEISRTNAVSSSLEKPNQVARLIPKMIRLSGQSLLILGAVESLDFGGDLGKSVKHASVEYICQRRGPSLHSFIYNARPRGSTLAKFPMVKVASIGTPFKVPTRGPSRTGIRNTDQVTVYLELLPHPISESIPG
jgi:hypothetical protein